MSGRGGGSSEEGVVRSMVSLFGTRGVGLLGRAPSTGISAGLDVSLDDEACAALEVGTAVVSFCIFADLCRKEPRL